MPFYVSLVETFQYQIWTLPDSLQWLDPWMPWWQGSGRSSAGEGVADLPGWCWDQELWWSHGVDVWLQLFSIPWMSSNYIELCVSHCFPNEFGQGIRWQHLGQGVMLWMLLSAASCCRFVMPDENFPDIVAWSRLELFLNVLSTGVLSVTIRRPISTHRRMESLASRCLTSFAPSPWCQVVDQTVTSGTNGLRMPYCDKAQRRLRRYWGSGFESRHFTCFYLNGKIEDVGVVPSY